MKEHRRVCHINAEQKRRCNIKNGFDMLQSLLPGGSVAGSSSGGSSGSGNSGGGGKSSDVSKAAMLHRGADYIRTLRTERQQQQEELEQLKQNIEVLNTAIRYFDSSRSSELLALLSDLFLPFLRHKPSHVFIYRLQWVSSFVAGQWSPCFAPAK